jgi:hypothetical protein
MIQRIQTLFLLLALLSMLLLNFFPYGRLLTEDLPIIDFSISGPQITDKINNNVDNFAMPLQILVGIVCFISFITIFLFKKRMIQIRLSVFNLVLQIGSLGLMYYFIYYANKQFADKFSLNVLFVMPIIALVLTYLAIRNIGKDEALVRSVNRIR